MFVKRLISSRCIMLGTVVILMNLVTGLSWSIEFIKEWKNRNGRNCLNKPTLFFSQCFVQKIDNDVLTAFNFEQMRFLFNENILDIWLEGISVCQANILYDTIKRSGRILAVSCSLAINWQETGDNIRKSYTYSRKMWWVRKRSG